MNFHDVEAVALKLALEDRAELARRLLVSLDEPTDEENERLWLEVAQERTQDLRDGKVKGVPAGDVLEDVRRRL